MKPPGESHRGGDAPPGADSGHDHERSQAHSPATPVVSAPGPDGHDHGEDGHGHSHGGVDASILGSAEAMRTLKLSLVILAITTALQVVVVILSGSIALLADTVHNAGDALTALPLAAAFMLSRRSPTRRLTYGYGRSEDFAGITVVAIILFSAVFAAYEAVDRLIHPHAPGYLWATAAAGVIGFLGNEWVAVYRIRSGRRIGSAALEADGYHARIDGFTSLAVVAGVAGVALGFQLADPIVGLLISLAIVRIVWRSAKAIGLRAMDGVDESVVEQIRAEAEHVPGVGGVEDIRARWLGHSLRAELAVSVPADATVGSAHEIATAVHDQLVAHVPFMGEAAVRPIPQETQS